jgi:hypothetical protein
MAMDYVGRARISLAPADHMTFNLGAVGSNPTGLTKVVYWNIIRKLSITVKRNSVEVCARPGAVPMRTRQSENWERPGSLALCDGSALALRRLGLR